jgi:hypothetical protein
MPKHHSEQILLCEEINTVVDAYGGAEIIPVCLYEQLFFLGMGWDLSPLGMSATKWAVVRAPSDRWRWVSSSQWNENWQGKPKYSEKTCPNATLSITNSTWLDLGLNPGRRGGKLAANHLSYSTANLKATSL